jgi:hypothetical protein
MKTGRPASIALCVVLASGPALAAETGDYKFFGDARIAFAASERETREGETLNREEDLRLRLRLGAETRLSEEWTMRGRLAGRYSTDQDNTRFWLKAWAPTRTGLEFGDATIDELYLDYLPVDGNWSLRAGRFQGKFALKGVASKSLDRYNSPNTDINWTDGLHLTYGTRSAWRSHLVLQTNASSGSGQVARAPLTFDDSGSRITVFAALEAAEPLGPLTQRLFTVTWMPSTLATDGLDAPARDDYFALTTKLFAEWPVGPMRGGLGAELGYAPATPAAALYNPADTGDADGLAWQFSINLWDIAPGHDIAFVHGKAYAGWLLSPDFRNNDRLLEVRYEWRISSKWTMTARLRQRQEIKVPADTPQLRVDDDFYLRFTVRF